MDALRFGLPGQCVLKMFSTETNDCQCRSVYHSRFPKGQVTIVCSSHAIWSTETKSSVDIAARVVVFQVCALPSTTSEKLQMSYYCITEYFFSSFHSLNMLRGCRRSEKQGQRKKVGRSVGAGVFREVEWFLRLVISAVGVTTTWKLQAAKDLLARPGHVIIYVYGQLCTLY
jgi:hypothetical protein